ncbi:MAG TPA: cytochrome c biogenesis protein CcdA [Tetrasphaera sp.]|uniref:urease accessory protein UreH domain-containing protein n=1 Tax=Nostocoides sp. TaxID=1917966 RepID=UPI002CCE0CF7|nr:cytochrome c biogenesis protein CcdA [Tetrasphaera sp.]HNQ08457.1 cytochrome c biogenesis protein CcdA [Tetrasphaera sp.]
MIAALAGALLAGALTTLAPCALTLLPVVVGGSLQGAVTSEARRRAVVITAALGASVVVFTLLLRVSTALIDVPPRAWQLVSGSVLVGLGVAATAPELWDRVAIATRLSSATAQGLSRSHQRRGIAGAALTGAALGPVFTSCSPLYAYVVVTVLPAEPARGLGLLAAYVLGLCAVLLAVGLVGQRAVRRLRWAADPHAAWRRALGVLVMIVGLLIATGVVHDVETWIVEHSRFGPWSWEPNLPVGGSSTPAP